MFHVKHRRTAITITRYNINNDRPVRINVRDFGIPEPEHINHPVPVIDIAGNGSADHKKPLFVHRQRQFSHPSKIRDQISGPVVRRPEDIGHQTG